MQLIIALLAFYIASIQAIPVAIDEASQVSYGNNSCGEQVSPCYQEAQSPGYDYQPEQDDGSEEDFDMTEGEGKGEGEGEGGDSMEDTTTQPELSYSAESGIPDFNIADIQPRQALLDKVNTHSSNKADALSNSNQFDQAQVIDQTLYQPKQQQHQIIITQPAPRSYGGSRKKYKRSAHKDFKIRYFSGNRYLD
ncbi:hypothetical protein K493DRAFT_308263 [Basidiobolus meristosporus CBS 931.73]|uniref:Uncharacterized protein n=1 Tax=Basidiobolus meristosporus CBS 931.73 TaxID=1314790 RepID=A0A1Y1X4H4_9FUNG|nr:hypothetical protein K493DRAFT_308263 [Basidiobolus meristosporus CBS 931.73]|eukprot:ORX80709.1 hypothetical protein K493DRAFT_308263 [Basidiobolus meristosporus CBS 931.73]